MKCFFVKVSKMGNIANLDGGSSTQLVINGELINNPMNVFGKKITGGRSVVTGFGLVNRG